MISLCLCLKKKKGLGFLGLGRRVEANSNKMFAEEEMVRA
jgi:hypothetical protein